MTTLVDAFSNAKSALTEEIQRCAIAGEWTKTQKYAQYANELEKMISGLSLNGIMDPMKTVESPTPATIRDDQRQGYLGKTLPYHFVSGNSLSKIGPSRDGSTYQHNVIRTHFDQIVTALVALSKSRREFETHELVQRCSVPSHEPLIVLAVCEQAGLLTKFRRGRYAFVDAANFEHAANEVWNKLPRN